MEEDKILKIIDKMPCGAPLYSSAFGEVTFNVIRYFAGGAKIGLLAKGGAIWYESSGKYRKGGEVTLYPSKEMRDWDKLAWKKGDVLTDDERFVIFKGFENDDYTEFFAPFEYNNNTFRQNLGLISNEFRKVNDDVAQEVIKKIEEHYSAKLNLETLKIEKRQEFKDGDILTCPATNLHNSCTFILKDERISGYTYYAAVIVGNSEELYTTSENVWCGKEENVRYATEEEKTKLFDILAKEGKRWNVEKKIIEDIRPVTKRPKPIYKKVSDIPEHEFEPFEKVLVRDQKTDKWAPDLYGSKGKVGRYNYTCIGGLCVYCIPYEGNEHLLGTTNNPD